jgi:diacylglycerol O-acyltransferase
VLLGVLGEALHRHGAPLASTDGRLRTAVPLGRHRVEPFGGAGGSGGLDGVGTAAMMLDLPVAAMTVRERIAAVADELRRLDRQGQSAAARFGVRAIGMLPAGPHARLSRIVYGGRFFGLIASVMPGRRRELRMLGTRLTSAYPILPLADGVGLAVGFLGWGEVVGVGVTADRALFPDAEGFAATLVQVFTELTAHP